MNQHNKTEEIDILQFFSAIGNMFKSMFKSITGVVKKLFFLSLDIILYLKKHYVYLLAGTLLGLGISFIVPSKNTDVYKAVARIRTNFNSQLTLQSHVKLFNGLIADKKYDELARILQEDTTVVKQIKLFELEPVVNDVLFIDDYEAYLNQKDTVVYKFIDYNTFKKNMVKNPDINPYWNLTVIATKPITFDFLNKRLPALINNDPELKKKKENVWFALQMQQKKLLRTLQDIDSLRKVNNQVMIELAKNKSNGAANIVVSSDRVRGPEASYNLFYERRKALEGLEKLSKKLNKFSDVLVMQNDFPQYGVKEHKITRNVHFRYTVLGFLLVLIMLLSRDFILYLNRYQQQKNRV